MLGRKKFFVHILAVFLFQIPHVSASAQDGSELGEIRLKYDQLAKSTRFVGIHIALSGAEFEGLQTFPSGWRIVIDRRGVWKGCLEMTPNEGVPPLTLEQVRHLGLRVRRIGSEAGDLSVSGHFAILTSQSETKNIPFGGMSFEYESVFIRRALR